MTDRNGEDIVGMKTTVEAAKALGVSVPTLVRMREAGKIQFYRYPSRTCRYPQSEIDRILKEGFTK